MYKSKFGWESYGRSKLALPIRKGGAEIRVYPHFLFYPDFLSSGTLCSTSIVLGTDIIGP